MITTKVKAQNLMEANVLTISVSSAVDEALRLLEEARISGAPVVDPFGKLLGVLSLMDLAEAKDAESEDGPRRPQFYVADSIDDSIDLDPDEYSGMQGFNSDETPAGTVAEWMTEDIISVPPNASARAVCKKMTDNRIHRVLVVEDDKLLGIITAYDVVRYIAQNG